MARASHCYPGRTESRPHLRPPAARRRRGSSRRCCNCPNQACGNQQQAEKGGRGGVVSRKCRQMPQATVGVHQQIYSGLLRACWDRGAPEHVYCTVRSITLFTKYQIQITPGTKTIKPKTQNGNQALSQNQDGIHTQYQTHTLNQEQSKSKAKAKPKYKYESTFQNLSPNSKHQKLKPKQYPNDNEYPFAKTETSIYSYFEVCVFYV